MEKVFFKSVGSTFALYEGQEVGEHGYTGYRGLLDGATALAVQQILNISNILVHSSVSRKTKRLLMQLYGSISYADEVGSRLSTHGIFLQSPGQLDGTTRYHNPQYLIRPGSTFQEVLERTSAKREHVLPEAAKSALYGIFDSAGGLTSFTERRVGEALKTELKLHQRQALAMMAEKESGNLKDPQFPSLWAKTDIGDSPSNRHYFDTVTGITHRHDPALCLGGILADDMGLGKSLTTLALIAGSVDTPSSTIEDSNDESVGNDYYSKCTLIVTPLSTLSNWEDQIKKHLKRGSIKWATYHGPARAKLRDSFRNYDVVFTTYETLKMDSKLDGRHGTRQMDDSLQSIPWRRVVLDEAHVIRNRASKSHQAVRRLEAKHRWCLTGTPVQNSVDDLGALVAFLRAAPFDDRARFARVFTDPIANRDDEGYECLRRLFRAIALRRTKDGLPLDLPPREERVEMVTLDPDEEWLYETVKKAAAQLVSREENDSGNTGGTGLLMVHGALQIILRLRQVSDHGRELLPAKLLERIDRGVTGKQLLLLDSPVCEMCGEVKESSDMLGEDEIPCLHQICRGCVVTDQLRDEMVQSLCPLCYTFDAPQTPRKPRSSHEAREPQRVPEDSYRPSSKVKALMRNLVSDRQQAEELGQDTPKSVVYSCWTKMLNLVEIALRQSGIQFARLDGGKSDTQRRAALRKFRDDPTCTVLLATLGSAGVGLDLTVASRVHILEPQWNPMVERQALDRVYRLGQRNPVTCFTYVVEGGDSIEQYVRRIQQLKIDLINSSLTGDALGKDGISRTALMDLTTTLRS